jgi:hypothetical protein
VFRCGTLKDEKLVVLLVGIINAFLVLEGKPTFLLVLVNRLPDMFQYKLYNVSCLVRPLLMLIELNLRSNDAFNQLIGSRASRSDEKCHCAKS